MFNLRWSGIVAAAAFVVSLTLGIFVRAKFPVVLLRAFCFGAAFFFLSVLIWRLARRYLPELFQPPPSRDESLMAGMEAGSRINITLGDGEIPQDVAVPLEESFDESVGNIADLARIGRSARETPQETPAPPANPPAAPVEGMDQSPPSGYTQNGEGENPAVSPPVPAEDLSGPTGPGDFFGDVESLPDLDALAGTFLSSDTAEEEEEASSPGSVGTGEYRSKKGKDVGEDFNPKELASAIQTILKRD